MSCLANIDFKATIINIFKELKEARLYSSKGDDMMILSHQIESISKWKFLKITKWNSGVEK